MIGVVLKFSSGSSVEARPLGVLPAYNVRGHIDFEKFALACTRLHAHWSMQSNKDDRVTRLHAHWSTQGNKDDWVMYVTLASDLFFGFMGKHIEECVVSYKTFLSVMLSFWSGVSPLTHHFAFYYDLLVVVLSTNACLSEGWDGGAWKPD